MRNHYKACLILGGLFVQTSFATEQFVSLNLCSDRLLLEIARPEQIAAMSPYSKNPLMMLDKVNRTKPTLDPKIEQLLPYQDKTFLMNEAFYPQLVEQMKALNFKIVNINSYPQTKAQLFDLMLKIGKITHNETKAKRLVSHLNLQNFDVKLPLNQTLLLSETGVIEMKQPQYPFLLKLLGLTPLKLPLTEQNFSLEKLILSNPNVIISFSDKQNYNNRAEVLNSPILQKLYQNRPLVTLPMKYGYCFDQGIWQGAEKVYKQLK